MAIINITTRFTCPPPEPAPSQSQISDDCNDRGFVPNGNDALHRERAILGAIRVQDEPNRTRLSART